MGKIKKIKTPSIPNEGNKLPTLQIQKVVAKNDLGSRQDKGNFRQEYKKHFKFRTYTNWLATTQVGEFNNCCKDAEEFGGFVYYVIDSMIPLIYENAYEIFINRNAKSTSLKHSHSVDKDHIKVVQDIAYNLTNEKYDDPELNWWEIGGKQSVRMFGIYFDSEPGFYPIFMDWHHLIYPDINFNNKDYKNYKYIPNKSNH